MPNPGCKARVFDVVDHLRPNVPGWKAYFRLAQTPKVWRERTASSHDLNFLNRPVRTRMPGGVAGERPERSPPMPIVRGPELTLGGATNRSVMA